MGHYTIDCRLSLLPSIVANTNSCLCDVNRDRTVYNRKKRLPVFLMLMPLEGEGSETWHCYLEEIAKRQTGQAFNILKPFFFLVLSKIGDNSLNKMILGTQPFLAGSKYGHISAGVQLAGKIHKHCQQPLLACVFVTFRSLR